MTTAVRLVNLAARLALAALDRVMPPAKDVRPGWGEEL